MGKVSAIDDYVVYLTDEQRKMSQDELGRIKGLASLETAMSNTAIIKEIPLAMVGKLTLDQLYELLTSKEGSTPEDEKIIRDIEQLIKNITPGNVPGIFLNEVGSVPCPTYNKERGTFQVPKAIPVADSGKLAAMKSDPTTRFITYKLEVAPVPYQGNAGAF